MEVHNVDVVVGTDGIHQDEFVRGDRPKDLLKNSILTPSLAAALINAKYVNAMPLDRMEKEFDRNEINISKQTMSNWLMLLSEKYFSNKLIIFPCWSSLQALIFIPFPRKGGHT